MAQNFSKEELIKFLDYLGNKGLMKANAIASRKVAVNAFLGILTPEETKNLTNINMDEVALRFANLKGSEFKPESMRVYKSRVSSSLEDFKKYRSNPMAFKPNASAAKSSGSPKKEKNGTPITPKKNTGTNPGIGEVLDLSPSEVSFPIPIRPNIVVTIVGIPSDLSKREATKIANVVMALAQDGDK